MRKVILHWKVREGKGYKSTPARGA